MGVVRDSEGQPVAGVPVALTAPSLPQGQVRNTNTEGEFSFAVPSGGTYRVSVVRIGYASPRATVAAAAGTSVIVEMVLNGAATTRVAEAPGLPFVQPFADAKNWVLQSPMVYRVANTQDSVVVPAGFVTDFASIPEELQSFASAMGPWTVGGVIHDYLYWEQGPQGCTRDEADGIFRLVMLENKASNFEAKAMHFALKMAGAKAFSGNAKARADGLPRILPSQYRTIRPRTLWPAYQQSVKAAGVRPGAPAAISRAFCRHGTSDPRDVLSSMPEIR